MLSIIAFILISAAGIGLFAFNARKVRRNINLGRDIPIKDNSGERLKTMIRVALGQSKMGSRPVAAILHLFVYVGFVLINIEVMEMMIDGISNGHRTFSFAGKFYNFLIGFFEVLAFLVSFGCLIFLIRRNIVRVKRFLNNELNGWPRTDANLILCSEIILMSALFLMNAADQNLQALGHDHYTKAGAFPISSFITPMLQGLSAESLIAIERFCWWFHLVGIFAFLNYLPYSKHFHILLAFPNTYFSNLKAKGKFTNPENVAREVQLMFDPNAAVAELPQGAPQKFGSRDVQDLTWKQLLDAYTCTECGRCTSSCPQNQTGKLLSPRKIMMDTRDRLTEVGKNIDANKGTFVDDGKSLLGDYITPEELWACNTCNACVQECPVNIDPLSIIVDLRRFLVMEQSAAPNELNSMFTNIENNGAPWQFSPSDRLNWANEN